MTAPEERLEFDPRNVDPTQCDHMASPPVCRCIHDWRIGAWGNPPRVRGGEVK
ncbi:hypothetical protein [Mycobacterium phage PP]|uniref:Head-to-tail connector protein n=1 Tax=Mycobacterium phage PP TaxID=2077134 RepID=A0A2Z5XVE2_9CAUD|nr:hypothetical protein KIW36_gp69 [Mycobacterium phage PP]BBC53822.1 hypothetical protein [Mycobacterium phage PP]